MRYYKDQHTMVDEEKIELETEYGIYLGVVALETCRAPFSFNSCASSSVKALT
jgi:hypothetical protein